MWPGDGVGRMCGSCVRWACVCSPTASTVCLSLFPPCPLRALHSRHTAPTSSRSNIRISPPSPRFALQLKKKTLEVTVWDYDRSSSNDFLGEVSIFRLGAPCLGMSKTLSIDLTRRLATAATAAALLIYFDLLALEQPLFIQADMIMLLCLHPMIMDVGFCFMPVKGFYCYALFDFCHTHCVCVSTLSQVLIDLSNTAQLDNTPRWLPLREQSESIEHSRVHHAAQGPPGSGSGHGHGQGHGQGYMSVPGMGPGHGLGLGQAHGQGDIGHDSPKNSSSVIKSRSHGIFPDPAKGKAVF